MLLVMLLIDSIFITWLGTPSELIFCIALEFVQTKFFADFGFLTQPPPPLFSRYQGNRLILLRVVIVIVAGGKQSQPNWVGLELGWVGVDNLAKNYKVIIGNIFVKIFIWFFLLPEVFFYHSESAQFVTSRRFHRHTSPISIWLTFVICHLLLVLLHFFTVLYFYHKT